MKPNEIAELVNRLRDIAVQFHDSQQLRERIAQEIRPLLSKLRATVADERELPPLPAAWGSAINDAGDGHVDLYSAEQMQEYTRAALASAPVVGEARCIGYIDYKGKNAGHARAVLTTGYDENGNAWADGTKLYTAAQVKRVEND